MIREVKISFRFWPGVLWYVYEYTQDPVWKTRADGFTVSLKPLAFHPATDHDLGFQMFCSYGNGLRLTGDTAYKTILLAAADTLAELNINLNQNDHFNKISIFEFQDSKQINPNDSFSNRRINRIQSYQIDIYKDSKWTTIFSDDQSMDDCKVIHLPVYYSASKIRLKVLKASAPPSVWEFSVIDVQN